MNQQIQNSNDAEAHKDDTVASNVSASDDAKAQSSNNSSDSSDSSSSSSAKLTSGILVCNVNLIDTGASRREDDVFEVNLDYIDPKTGSFSNTVAFSNKETHSCYYQFDITRAGVPDECYDGSIENSLRFSDDYSKYAAAHDGATGWVDAEGNFTSFTRISSLLADTSDFSGATTVEPIGFGSGGWYYFIDGDISDSSDNSQCKRIPVDNISKNAIEVVGDARNFSFETPMGIYSYTYGIGSKHQYNNPALEDLSKLIPDKKGRYSFNPVSSPDNTQVAFLSALDSSPELFIVPSTGGEPTKVATSYDFSTQSKMYDSSDGYGENHYSYLLAWN